MQGTFHAHSFAFASVSFDVEALTRSLQDADAPHVIAFVGNELDGHARALETALPAGDWNLIARTAHAIADIAADLSATVVSTLGLDLEAHLDHGYTAGAAELAETLVHDTRRLIDDLDTWLAADLAPA